MYTIGNRLPLSTMDMMNRRINKYEKLAFDTSNYIQRYCHDMFVFDLRNPSEIVLKIQPSSDYENISSLILTYINFLVKTYRIEDPFIYPNLQTGSEAQRFLHMLNASIQAATNYFLRNNQLYILIEALSTNTKEFR